MTAQQYFDDYDSDGLDLSKEDFAEIWNINKKYFITILNTCPFPIPKDAYNWILMATLDI